MSEHPIRAGIEDAVRSAIVYHDDHVTGIVAGRSLQVLAVETAHFGPTIAYGEQWQAIVGLLQLTDTLTAAELALVDHTLTMRMRRLRTIAYTWLTELGAQDYARNVAADLMMVRVVSERVRISLECAAWAQLLHPYVDEHTRITRLDEVELTTGVRTVLTGRGVTL